MSKTVEDILRESGLNDEAIKALDAKVTGAFTTVLSTASAEAEKAANERRMAAQQYETEIAPALDKWANDSANLNARNSYLETLVKKAQEGGFLPDTKIETPAAVETPRGEDGKFVAGK